MDELDDAALAALDDVIAAAQAPAPAAADEHRRLLGSVPLVKEAGILLQPPSGGLWFCEMKDKDKTVLADYGGKSEPKDVDAWATAVRECREESGVDVSDHKLSSADQILLLRNKTGLHGVVFVVPSAEKPKVTGDPKILRHVLVQNTLDPNALHPRLRFASGVQGRLRALVATPASTSREQGQSEARS